jgi:hypothetical protein
MVSYQTWTAIAYQEAVRKGAEVEGEGTARTNRELLAVIAEIWRDRKADLSTATRTEAREIADQEISVA